VPSLSIIFQSTPSFLTPYPTSLASTTSGPSTIVSSSRIVLESTGDEDNPLIELTEGEREGEGGGKARDGNLAIGRSDR
jgi:hypothetical protein